MLLSHPLFTNGGADLEKDKIKALKESALCRLSDLWERANMYCLEVCVVWQHLVVRIQTAGPEFCVPNSSENPNQRFAVADS